MEANPLENKKLNNLYAATLFLPANKIRFLVDIKNAVHCRAMFKHQFFFECWNSVASGRRHGRAE